MASLLKLTMIMILAMLHFVTFGVSSSTYIKTNNGQIFKCVDFYKQPSVRNLPLKQKVNLNVAKLERQRINVSDFGLGGRGCPYGTVPILERSKIGKKVLDGDLVPPPRPKPKPQAKEHCSAGIRTIDDATKTYTGAQAGTTIWKPDVQSNQWSSSRIKLVNGDESIEAGWMVNPDEFKDNEAHLYGRFKARGKSCINVACPGFVQVPSDVALGITPSHYSNRAQQILWKPSLDKHTDDGNWWLSLVYNNAKIQIGYWPKTLFTTLSAAAARVEFGGEISDPGSKYPSPSMGNGAKAVGDSGLSAAFIQVAAVDQGFTIIFDLRDTEEFTDCPELYTVFDGGFQGGNERTFTYGGGPGPLG